MVSVNDTVRAIGSCHALLFDGPLPAMEAVLSFVNGVADAPTNLVSYKVSKNRLSDIFVASTAAILVDQYVKTPSRIKLGTGAPTPPQTGPLSSDIDCWTPDNATLRDCDVKTTFLSTNAEYGVTYDTTEINGVTYTEAVLLDIDSRAWAHVYFTTSFTKNSTQTAVFLWKIVVVGN